MISIEIGLLVLLIAFLCTQVYPFQQTKLERGKYDEYGFVIILWTVICMYLADHYLQENHWQRLVRISAASFTAGFSIACVGKQFLYDYRQRKFPFQRK
ncbi:hypothetical protein [Bacillus arachidis]|uniref:hypothetical protein n=1 Tax=Bacillus arachidis TaxID=2819290 RepID=UPI00255CC096|nr:hypothetical protein [Bacillus arachidis]WIY59021.1 hypothetical protein QRY57_01255 [Bacillus arachidis]